MKINIKNCTCHYFDHIREVDEYINVDKVLLGEKSYENILAYNISWNKFMDAKPLQKR